jgi:hypothetical protein
MVFSTNFVLLVNVQCDQKVSVQLFLYCNRQVHRDFLITLYKDVTFSCSDSNNIRTANIPGETELVTLHLGSLNYQ